MSHTIRWTVEKITQRLALITPLVYRNRIELPNFEYYPSQKTDEMASPQVLEPNQYWGSPDTEFTLRSSFQIPLEFQKSSDNASVALYLPLGEADRFSHPEALIFIDGRSFASCDRHHQEVLLPPAMMDGNLHTLELKGWTGLGDDWNTSKLTRLVMRPCAVVQVDQPTRDFVILTRVALETAKILAADDPVRVGLLNALDEAYKLLDIREPIQENFYESVHSALNKLKNGISEAGKPLPVSMTATGHAHIDVAWLWPLDQTRQKAARTFHTVLRLMEQFPAYHYTQSQPQLYEFIQQDHPALFELIKKRVAEKRWEPIGGMWVEADCNLSGAESLARQFLLGRSYFRNEFGKEAESPVLWLPDVFGYAWALPQLIKQAGLKYFFTIKLGWNQYNHIPYDSFWWQGLDGSRVLTHFSTAPEYRDAPSSTYNAPANPESALYSWKNFQQKEIQKETFMAFGYGDGGGGPTREMIENLNVIADFPGLPQARQRSAGDFFSDLEHTSGEKLPTWNGELYLELHRGTYTTQSPNKRANRKAEFALHDCEFLASYASLLNSNYEYPKEAFAEAWKLVCLNQFHDIIPGSSIGRVYVDSQKQYQEIQKSMQQVRTLALDQLVSKINGDWAIVNPTSFAWLDPVFIPDLQPHNFTRDNRSLISQQVEGGVLVDAGEIPPYSVISIQTSDVSISPADSIGKLEEHVLENNFLRVEFSPSGDIKRIFEKINQREVLPLGEIANQFQAFEDRPKYWDAWDIDIFYDDKSWLADSASSIKQIESGPLRSTLEIKRKILNSTYTQRISLSCNSARLDFDTHINWQEKHVLLKVAFPVDVLAPQATFDIQWGNVQRPTHRNTSWDWARFETCAHKWVDLSEGGYGVSLLNDCKYGHDVQGNILRLSLLRAPTSPDPEADQGEHRFVYSLLPHAGSWQGCTPAEGYQLNDPVIIFPCKSNQTAKQNTTLESFVSSSSENVIVETIKSSEDGKGFIFRLFENERIRGEVILSFAFPVKNVEKTNLLEECLETLKPDRHQLRIYIKPYEIVTLRVIPE